MNEPISLIVVALLISKVADDFLYKLIEVSNTHLTARKEILSGILRVGLVGVEMEQEE
jgi:hypothetical protein